MVGKGHSMILSYTSIDTFEIAFYVRHLEKIYICHADTYILQCLWENLLATIEMGIDILKEGAYFFINFS